MVREHLPVVFPPLFDIDDEDLLEPEGELGVIVPFHEGGHVAGGEVGPEFFEVEPVF